VISCVVFNRRTVVFFSLYANTIHCIGTNETFRFRQIAKYRLYYNLAGIAGINDSNTCLLYTCYSHMFCRCYIEAFNLTCRRFSLSSRSFCAPGISHRKLYAVGLLASFVVYMDNDSVMTVFCVSCYAICCSSFCLNTICSLEAICILKL